MVGIWAAAFAQQLSDRLEDIKAENAIKQMANDEYNRDLIQLYEKQHEDDKNFYERAMIKTREDRIPYEGDIEAVKNAIIQSKVAVPASEGGSNIGDGTMVRLTEEQIASRINDKEVYKFIRGLRNSTGKRFTPEMYTTSIKQIMKTNPNVFLKEPTLSDVRGTDETTDPIAMENLKSLQVQRQMDNKDDTTFLKTTSDFLSPLWAKITNEPTNRLSEQDVISLMKNRYGSDYSKIQKYREEYTNQGKRTTLNPEVTSELTNTLLDMYTKREEGIRSARIKSEAALRYRIQKLQEKGSPIEYSISSINKNQTQAKNDFIRRRSYITGEKVDEDINGNLHIKFETDKGAQQAIAEQNFNLLEQHLNGEFEEIVFGELQKYNKTTPQAEVFINVNKAIRNKSIALKVVKETQKEIEDRGGKANVPNNKAIEILQNKMRKYKLITTGTAAGSPSIPSPPSSSLSPSSSSDSMKIPTTSGNFKDLDKTSGLKITEKSILPDEVKNKYMNQTVTIEYDQGTGGNSYWIITPK